MHYSDYIVMVDESGQPYIAHAKVYGENGRVKWGASARATAREGFNNARERVHTYLDKIKTKSGKWRYIYDAKELAAVGKRVGRNAKRSFDNAIGITARKRLEVANKARDYKKANLIDDKGRSDREVREKQRDYDRTILGRGERALNRMRDLGSRTLLSIRNRNRRGNLTTIRETEPGTSITSTYTRHNGGGNNSKSGKSAKSGVSKKASRTRRRSAVRKGLKKSSESRRELY